MKDGNKESAKELLSTFRTLGAISLSVIIFSLSDKFIPHSGKCQRALILAADVAFLISIISSVYICFVVIPKLFHEIDHIIYQRDVWIPALGGIATFAIGCALVTVARTLTP